MPAHKKHPSAIIISLPGFRDWRAQAVVKFTKTHPAHAEALGTNLLGELMLAAFEPYLIVSTPWLQESLCHAVGSYRSSAIAALSFADSELRRRLRTKTGRAEMLLRSGLRAEIESTVAEHQSRQATLAQILERARVRQPGVFDSITIGDMENASKRIASLSGRNAGRTYLKPKR